MAAFLYPRKAGKAAVAALAVLAGVALSGIPALAASQFVVISAEPVSDSFPPGKVLVPGDTIELPEGTSLTLLGEDGSVVAIPGPARIAVTEDAVETTEDAGAAKEKNRSTLSKLASLLAGEQRNADSLGVSRGFDAGEGANGLADPWVLSVHRSAQGCVRNEAIRLGRASDADAVSLTVRGDSVDAMAELEWKAGESVVQLPQTIPPTSDEILVKAGPKTVFIDLNLLPESVAEDDPMAVMGWMVQQGCDGQALAYARLLAHEAQ